MNKTRPCNACGAPTIKVVLPRGGEYGWGDDASRTVQQYKSLLDPPKTYAEREGIKGVVERLKRYSRTGDNRNNLQGQTMEDAARFIEHTLTLPQRQTNVAEAILALMVNRGAIGIDGEIYDEAAKLLSGDR